MQSLILEHGSQRLEAAPWRGGLAFSYRVDGEEVLYLDRASFDDPAKNVRGGIPVLFPWAGPLPEGTFGTSGALPQHGLARQATWEVEGEELVHRSETVFPWKYELRVHFELGEELRIVSSVTNHDSREMPVQLGFHPYFAVEDKSTLTFDLPAATYRDNDEPSRPDHPFPGRLPLTERAIDWELRGLSERKAVMTGRRRLELRWSERFPVLVVWSLLDKPGFVCLEPWTAGRFAQSTGDPDLWHVAPGATESAWWSVKVS